MTEQAQTESFVYTQATTSKIFPIDCSGRELGEITKVTHAKVKSLILDESPMRDQIKSLILNDSSKIYDPAGDREKVPYPVEGKQFFECYINTAKKSTYKKLFVNDEAKGKRKKFLREFCLKLGDALLPEYSEHTQTEAHEDLEQKAFARHTVFGNSAFAREVMSNVWKKEFMCRVRTIQERAKRLPYAQQAAVLKHYLAIMDEWILSLPVPEDTKPTEAAEEKEPEVELQEMFEGLLAHRVKCGESRNGLAEYQIKNIAFESITIDDQTIVGTMKDAFEALDGRGDKCSSDLLNNIRKPYIQKLGNMDTPSFETEYIALHNYLTDASMESDQIKAKFVEEMKIAGASVLDRCIISDETWQEHGWVRNKHIETLLSVTAIRNINQHWPLVEQTRDFQMMRLANRTARNIAVSAIRAEIDKVQSAFSGVTNNVLAAMYKGIISALEAAEQTAKTANLIWTARQDGPDLAGISNSFITYFNDYGTWLGYDKDPFENKEKVETAAKRFAKKTNEAVKFFGQEDKIEYSETGVLKLFETCVEMAQGSEKELPFDCVFEFVPPLQLGLLSQILHKITINSNGEAMKGTLETLYS